MKLLAGLCFIFSVIFITGCGQQNLFETKKVCECQTVFDFPEIVHPANSFMIRGKCKIEIPTEKINESYDIQFFFDPPSNLYVQLDHLLIKKAILTGGNDDEYWLWIRHNEVDAYWFGSWQQGCMDASVSMALNPSVILEAMNLSYCQPDYDRVGCSCNAYVFNRMSTDGMEKKLWFDCCSEKLRKIEFLNPDKSQQLICQIKDSFAIADGVDLPLKLEMAVYDSKSDPAAIAIIEFKPNSFKLRDFTNKFRDKYFTKPDPKGAEHIYNISDTGQIIKIKQ